jgi:hypothetical protein
VLVANALLVQLRLWIYVLDDQSLWVFWTRILIAIAEAWKCRLLSMYSGCGFRHDKHDQAKWHSDPDDDAQTYDDFLWACSNRVSDPQCRVTR